MSTEEQVRRKARVLAGFMSQEEANGFAISFVLDPTTFMNAWTECAKKRPALARGYTAPRVEDPTPEVTAHVTKLKAHKAFAMMYPRHEFKMVELGRLIAFQHWMDTDVSDGVHGAGSAEVPEMGKILEKCLPLEIIPPSRTHWTDKQAGDALELTVYSHNNTLGIVGAKADKATGQVTIVVGPRPNLMLVREHGGRYVLANGYHRAWWLRSKGVEMVPVVLVHAASPNEMVQPGSVQIADIFSDRPPLVDDFLADEVATTVDVRATLRAVKIRAEVSTVPRLL